MPFDADRVLLSHGAGGSAMSELIDSVFLNGYGGRDLPRDDSASLALDSGRIAFTTDSFIVDPLFFPGGDIGRLAVAGTVNDLLTSAARPIALAASFIIEEGLETAVLRAVVESMRKTAEEANVKIVTGDTKVAPRGAVDKLFITTAGIGEIARSGVSGASVVPGDKVIFTGTLGDHGAAVMLAREGLLQAKSVESDAAPLNDIVMGLLESDCEIHAMRDPTRGGVAAALNEIARQSSVAIDIDESRVAVNPGVEAICEALGLDVCHVANEGKMLVFVSGEDAERTLSIIRGKRYGEHAHLIGEAHTGPAGRVSLRTSIGTTRILKPPSGTLLPRIC